MEMKKVLFVHQNFPGQFAKLAPYLSRNGYAVKALRVGADKSKLLNGVDIIGYDLNRASSNNIHPWVEDTEAKIIRAECCYRKAMELNKVAYVPDLIISHPGWGESLFLKDVWPSAKLGIYCEYYYKENGADTGFDLEFKPNDKSHVLRTKLKNLNNLLHFEVADAGISPTHWQASTFPDRFRSKIAVIHDGIDTEALAPNAEVSLSFKNPAGEELKLSKQDEVITFVNRNLEPYRGYHVFMRALPELLKRRPKARVLIVGGDDVSYGARPENGQKWKDIFAAEVRPQMSDADWSRVHFLGSLPYQYFIPLLQLSTVHVYLTYPFVLSWSLLEAMSVGCAIVASDTQPLHEAIQHNETGRLVNFFNHQALAAEVCSLLDNLAERKRLGANARAFAQKNYDLKTVCLPAQLDWVNRLANSS